MPVAEVRGTELYFETRGDVGDPIVLVHGSWVDHTTWEAVVPLLERSFRVLTYDLRGHGRSARTLGPHLVDDHLRDLEGLLSATDQYPAHVVGSSLGAAIAVLLAAERPDLFRSLVVHDAPLPGLLEEDARRAVEPGLERMDAVAAVALAGDARGAAREFVNLVGRRPDAWSRLPALVQETYVANAASWLAEYQGSRDLTVDLARLSEFDPPALLTTGERSPEFFRHVARRLSGALPNARTLVLPDAGHVPHVTNPGQFVGVLASFLLERTIPTG